MLILPKAWAFSGCAVALVVSAGVDLARNRGHLRFLWFLFKDRERKRISGATALAASYTLLAGLFPPAIAGFAMIFFSLSDPLASFFGRFVPLFKVGSKSIGGALSFILLGFVLSLALPEPKFYIKIVASVVGAVVELFTQDVDDNFTVPIGVGVVMLLMTWL